MLVGIVEVQIIIFQACYDIREGSVFWSKMDISSDLTADKIPEWISTHPSHENRVELFDFLLPEVNYYTHFNNFRLRTGRGGVRAAVNMRSLKYMCYFISIYILFMNYKDFLVKSKLIISLFQTLTG